MLRTELSPLKIHLLKLLPLTWWHLEMGFREIIRVRWDHEGGAPTMGLVPLRKRYMRPWSLPIYAQKGEPVHRQQDVSHLQAKSRGLRMKTDTWILDFPASRKEQIYVE